MVKISEEFKSDYVYGAGLIIGMYLCFLMAGITYYLNLSIIFLIDWILFSVFILECMFLLKVILYLNSIKRKATKL